MTLSEGRSITSAPYPRSPTLAWMIAGLAPVVSLAVFRPWIATPFPVWDYADLIPLLRDAGGWWNGIEALAGFNRADGRANYLSYVQFALTWAFAGENPAAWQVQRASFMLIAAVLLVLVARRLGATPLAAGFAATLFTVSVPATEGWLFMIGEPLALILLLLLVLAGAGYRVTPAWKTRGMVIGVLAGLVMLTKEFLGILIPAALVVAVCWAPDRGLVRPRWTRREQWLGLLLLGVLAVEGWSVVSALNDAVPGAYARGFGRAGFDSARALTLWQAMLFPARFASGGFGSNLYPANFAFLLVLVLGLARPAHLAAQPRKRAAWAIGLLSVPLFGALAYALWPRYSAFYGIPFVAGSLGLFAAGASAIERSHRVGRWVVMVLGLVAVSYSAILAGRVAGEKVSLARLAVAVSHSFASTPPLDTVMMVTPSQGGRRWPVTAKELRRYGLAIGVPDSVLPVMVDRSCEEVGARLAQPLGRNGVLNDQNPCGRLPEVTRRWLAPVPYRDWVSFRTRTDTVMVDLLAPSWKPAS